MKYRLLGNTGLRVSEIALGTMAYGGAQYQFTDYPVSKEDAAKTLNKALELEINHIDCADIYGAYGNAEKIIGETIKGYDREEIILSSKLMMPMSRHELDRGLGRKHVLKSIDRAIRENAFIEFPTARDVPHATGAAQVIGLADSILRGSTKVGDLQRTNVRADRVRVQQSARTDRVHLGVG